jgi:hypothetical protein
MKSKDQPIFAKQILKEMDDYKIKGRTFLNYLVSKDDDFLGKLQNMDEEEYPEGCPLPWNAIGVLIALNCHRLHTGNPSVIEDEALEWVKYVQITASLASLVKNDLIEVVKNETKWGSPSDQVGVRMIDDKN